MAHKPDDDSSDLRRRAEQVQAANADGASLPSPEDIQALVHDLEVHRIELEMQNMALRESQQELEASRDRYADLYDFAPVGYLTIDGRGMIQEANLTAAKMFNTARRQLLGRRLVNYLAPRESKRFFEELGRCAGVGESVALEVDLASRTGLSPRTVQLKMESVQDHRPDALQIRMAITDVTELRRAASTAEEASQTKSRFLANVSHEMRTPMAVILGYAELLEDPRMSEPERSEYLAVIRRNGQSLLQLISDVLDLSRIEAGRLEIDRRACSPRQVVEEVAATLTPLAAQKGLRLAAEFEEPFPDRIETDADRLRQILVNLVGNAVKFTEQGEVRVVAGVSDAQNDVVRLRFRVIDSGMGIAEDKLTDIFQPFRQVDDSSTRRYGGTGLGLSVSQRLAELLDGHIEVQSKPGQGSTFTLWIDARLPPPEAPQPEPGSAQAAAQHPGQIRGRVLVVDDARDVRHLVRTMLERAGLEVDTAESGEVGCRKVLLHDPGKPHDLVFMDVQMPGIDGFEATRLLRQGGWTGPVVALTAHAMAGDRERCLAAGCDDYLSKPIDRATLLSTVARWVTARADR